MSDHQIQKTEIHITSLPREIDRNLAIALGEMVVAFGRLEYMVKVAIKRLEKERTLDQVLRDFSGGRGTLGKLVEYCCSHFRILNATCAKADELNKKRQDFVHATIAATEERRYVRFRKLIGYADLSADIARITDVTTNANSLVEELDQQTSSVSNESPPSQDVIANVSAPTSHF